MRFVAGILVLAAAGVLLGNKTVDLLAGRVNLADRLTLVALNAAFAAVVAYVVYRVLYLDDAKD